jgi:hypothetical protein
MGYRFEVPQVKQTAELREAAKVAEIETQLTQVPVPQPAVVTKDEAADFQKVLDQAVAELRQTEQESKLKGIDQKSQKLADQMPKIRILPQLILEMPETTTLTTKDTIGIRGKAVDVKTLIINGEPIWINEKGYFYAEIRLKKGMNEIVFKGYSKTKDVIKLTRVVNRIK